MIKTSLTKSKRRSTELTPQSVTSLTVSEAIRYFAAWLTNQGNYPRLARVYLDFCIENSYSVDKFSLNLFATGLAGNRISPVRKFLSWYDIQGQPQIRPDPPIQRKSIPAADALILQFMADPENNLVDSSRETYLRILNNFFNYIFQQNLDRHPAGFNSATVRDFLQMPAQTRSKSTHHKPLSAFTYNLYMSAIKQLAQWVINHPEDQNLQIDQIKDLQKNARLKAKKVPKGFF